MRCPYCELTTTTEDRARTALGHRRFRCGDCQRAFNERGGAPFNCACVDGEDPVWGHAVALFNPRGPVWADHFQWSEQRPFEIEGITAYGRVTVVRLQMNHADLVGIRRLLAELGPVASRRAKRTMAGLLIIFPVSTGWSNLTMRDHCAWSVLNSKERS